MSGGEKFQALCVAAERTVAQLVWREVPELAPEEVLIQAEYSSLNYKDALACTGRGKVLRRFPLVPGIDVAGTVAHSSSPRYQAGDAVLVTGCGLGEEQDGGFAGYVRVSADWVVPLPEGLNAWEAMALGTAGFTAALALYRMEQNGQRPDLGPILVTGATGGVGSVAVNLFADHGYEVHALTGKPDQQAYLQQIGATGILDRHALALGERPLEQARWGGAVDNVGGDLLAWLTRTVQPWGSIASIGLAGGHALHTTVMPFILRGVSLLGIQSVYCPMELRRELWRRLAGEWRPSQLAAMVSGELPLADVPAASDELLGGQGHGRRIVRLPGD